MPILMMEMPKLDTLVYHPPSGVIFFLISKKEVKGGDGGECYKTPPQHTASPRMKLGEPCIKHVQTTVS